MSATPPVQTNVISSPQQLLGSAEGPSHHGGRQSRSHQLQASSKESDLSHKPGQSLLTYTGEKKKKKKKMTEICSKP
jgi:hypothetical protein